MINNANYIRLSLELHLFFARIMKEHSFFLEIGFMEKDSDFKRRAREFQIEFGNVLRDVLRIADYNISEEVIASEEIVTNNTLEAEKQSSNLTGIRIDEEITRRELQLRAGRVIESASLLREVNDINERTLRFIDRLIDFKTTILNRVLECKMFTANYPLLIEHILNEAKMYRQLLTKLQNKEPLTNEYICEQELFWDIIMKQHAEFVRGLLDPTEAELILTANKYAEEYKRIIENNRNNCNALRISSLQETIKFKAFKETAEQGILNCEIKSIIVPLLTDHILREANHFIRLLKSHSLNIERS